MKDFDILKFDEKGLIPAIVQDIETSEVLMLAYMNRESIERTLDTGTIWFYSRSRKKLWNKGETSGNFQKVRSISYDCDGDTLLIKVEQNGVACHTGSFSCFYNLLLDINKDNDKSNYHKFIKILYKIIENRKGNPKQGSYTSYLFSSGLDKILKKVGEESSEVIIGAKNNNKDEVIYEIGDLVYHILVLMVEMGVKIQDIEKELYKRHNFINDTK